MKLFGTSKTKESKYNSTVSLVVGIAMLLVAVIAFDFSELPLFGKIFMLVWVGVVCSSIYQSYRNAFGKKSLHHEVTDHELTLQGFKGRKPSNAPPEKDYANRLRKLENLYRDGLITTPEYEAKRQDILDEDWGS